MQMTLKARQQKIVEEFSQITNWEDRYRRIIELGKQMPDMPEILKIEDIKVKGCQSQVWLHAHLDDDGQIIFQADSDALIVKGLIALLLRVYSDATADEILTTQPDFIATIGLAGNLSPSRANGLFAMVKQIKYYATAFKALQSR
jgi:cysteine desulfuration protein SufE